MTLSSVSYSVLLMSSTCCRGAFAPRNIIELKTAVSRLHRCAPSAKRFASTNGQQDLPSLRLEYLPFQAMAEPTRMLLHYGKINFEDFVVWGNVFYDQREKQIYPFNKVPLLHVKVDGETTLRIAQSGTLARYAARLAGAHDVADANSKTDTLAWTAWNDAIFDLAQEMCTVNPLINCMTGQQYEQTKKMYFNELNFPSQVRQLCRQLQIRKESLAKATGTVTKTFFGGTQPSHADFNVLHMLMNAELAEKNSVASAAAAESPRAEASLLQFMQDMQSLEGVKEYLEKRPKLVGIGYDPGLEDREGTVVSQRHPKGCVWIVDGKFDFDGPAQ